MVENQFSGRLPHYKKDIRQIARAIKNTMDEDEKLQEILAHYGVTLCEYDAMSCPYYGVPGNPQNMAIETVFEIGGKFTADDYLDAIHNMIQKGWLCLATVQDCHSKSRLSNIPKCDDLWAIQLGDVIFTKQGYFLHRAILQDSLGYEFVQKNDSFHLVDWKKRRIDFYAETEDICHHWLFMTLKEGFSDLIGGLAEVIDIESPIPIARWQPSRFLVIERGYHCGFTYKRLRRRKFIIKALQLYAMIESFPLIYITGKIEGKEFSFTETLGWISVNIDGSINYSDDSARYSWRFIIEGEPTMFTIGVAQLQGESEVKNENLVPTTLFMLEEENYREKMLSIKDAKKILMQCCEKYYLSKAHPNHEQPSSSKLG